MHDDSLFYDVERYLKTIHVEDRLMEAVKLFFTYHLTQDQLGDILSSGIVDSELGLASHANNLPWFQRFTKVETYEKLQEADRPFIWSLETLNEEFPDFLSHFGAKQKIDVSKAERNDVGFYNAWITEEHGFLEVGEIMISRTIQPIFFELQVTEPVVFVFPKMTGEKFVEIIPHVPSLYGGCAFEGIVEARPINPRFADLIGLSGVSTIMIYRGFVKDGDTIALEQQIGVDPDMYLDYQYKNESLCILTEMDKAT